MTLNQTIERIGKYRIRRPMGRGGMAEVYEAEMHGPAGFKKTVCIKRIRKEFADHPQFRAAFESEARIAAALNHPNVVEIYDFDRVSDQLFLVMEYVDGVNLQTVLNESRSMGFQVPITFAIHIMLGLLDALAHAHSLVINGTPTPIIHRDVSPQNILIARDGTVKLTDFGIAKAKGLSSTTVPGMVKGKLAYLSPEQALGHPLSPVTDLFSAGTLFYEMLAGNRLFVGDDSADVISKIRSFTFTPIPFISSELNRLLALLLVANPAKRCPSAAHALSTLSRFASGHLGDSDIVSRIVEQHIERQLGSTALLPIKTQRMTHNDSPMTDTPVSISSIDDVSLATTASKKQRPLLRPAVIFFGISIFIGIMFLLLAVWHHKDQERAIKAKTLVIPPPTMPVPPPHHPSAAPVPAPTPTGSPLKEKTVDSHAATQSTNAALPKATATTNENDATPSVTSQVEDTRQPSASMTSRKRNSSRSGPKPEKLLKIQTPQQAEKTAKNEPMPPITDIEQLKNRPVSFETVD